MSAPDPVFSHSYRDAIFLSAWVELFMNGIYSAVVLFTFFTVMSRKTLRGSNVYLLGVILLLFAMSIIHLGNHAFYVRQAFINHADTSDETIGYMLTPNNLSILSDTMAVAMAFFADCILAWRVYVVWSRNWRALVLPSILITCSLIFGIWLVKDAHSPPNSVDVDFVTKLFTTYYSFNLTTTIVCTLLIAGRIVQLGGAPGLARYWHVLEVVVESAILYAVVLIIYMPYIVIVDPIKSMPVYIVQAIVVPITGIAPTLIVARVALGLSQRDNTWVPPVIHSGELRFGSTTEMNRTGAGTGTKYESYDAGYPLDTVHSKDKEIV